ncbi:XylR family transcriptional regulator [Aeoliella sp.]|uniref:XylR family transcriptional regulator n=1 Tax=Aeoliella sp. TaxID=2795800 RepID=UPI003CCBF094
MPATSKKSKDHENATPHVALIVETSTSFGRGVMSGIAQYIRENAPWSVYFTERSALDPVPAWIRKWKGDGVISRALSPDVVRSVIEADIPLVDLNEQFRGLGVPMISNDHGAIGQMAAEHLMERGFTRFAYIGHRGVFWSDVRFQEFQNVLTSEGHRCEQFGGRAKSLRAVRQGTWELELTQVAKWIESLEKPVGVFVGNDFRAVQFLAACRMADVAVPEEVAVLGVGDDTVACELANPPLSSVLLNAHRMGYEAASLLECLMKGDKPRQMEVLIPPLSIVTRQSTDVTAIADPIVAKAMRYIRENACNGINIDDVLRHVLVSRTALQDHFRSVFDRSIHEMIIAQRISRARELLLQSDLSLADVAERSGFRHAEYLSTVFKQRTGWTPAKYRQQHGYSQPSNFQIKQE